MIRRVAMVMTLGLFSLGIGFPPKAKAAIEDLTLSAERQKVVDRFMDILLSDARNDYAFRRVFDAYKAEKKDYRFLDFVKKLVRLERKDPERLFNVRLLLGRLYLAFRDPYQAGIEFQTAAGLFPQRGYPHYMLGEVRRRQKDYPAALKSYQKAVAFATEIEMRVLAYHGTASCHAAERRWKDAIEAWNQVVELRPYDAGSYRRLAESVAEILIRDEQTRDRRVGAEAEAPLDQRTRDLLWNLCETWRAKIVDLVKDDVEKQCDALLALSELHVQRKRFEEAVKQLRRIKSMLSESHWLVMEIDARIRRCAAEQQRSAELLADLRARAAGETVEINVLIELAGALEAQAEELKGEAATAALEAAAGQVRLACKMSPRDVQLLERYRGLCVRLQNDAAVEETSRKLVEISPENVHYKLDVAEYYVSRGNPEKARAVWKAVIDEDPKQPLRRLVVARAMQRAEAFEAAEEQYRALIEIVPEVEAHRIELAEMLLNLTDREPAAGGEADTARERRIAQVKDLLLPAVRRGRLSLAETQRVAILLLDHRLLGEARQTLETAHKRFADDMMLATMLGEVYLRMASVEKDAKRREGFYDRSIRTYLAAFDLAPHPAIRREMNGQLMSLCLAYGRWDLPPKKGRVARGGYRGLHPLVLKHLKDYYGRPEDPMPPWCLGDIQQQMTQGYLPFPKSKYPFMKGERPAVFLHPAHSQYGLAYFNQALSRDPLLLSAYSSKSIAYTLRDSFEQAVSEHKKLSVIDPVNKWKYFLHIGDLFANEGQFAEALAFWDRVSERVFTDATIMYQLACRYFRAEKAERAVGMLERAIEANPRVYGYHMTLGNMHDYLGEYRRASDCYVRALQLSTQSMLLPLRRRLAQILRHYAEQLFAEGKWQAALEHFEKIRAFQVVLQDFYRKEKDTRALAALSPELADTAVQIARCFEKLGRRNEADRLYETVKAETPTSPIRLSRTRSLALGYLLALREAGVPLRPDAIPKKGDAPAAAPLHIDLVKHAKVWEMAREHSVTPEGVLFHGLDRWVEVEPVSGKVLRAERSGKLIRYRNGIEVRVLRHGPDKGKAGTEHDSLAIRRRGKVARYVLPAQAHVRAADLLIDEAGVYFQTVKGRRGKPGKLLAVEAASGAVRWQAESPTDRLYRTGAFLIGMQFVADQTLLYVHDATTGRLVLKKDLGRRGIWLRPEAWGRKLFLVDDIAWRLKMLDVDSGEWDYERRFQGTFPRGPILHDGVLYVHERRYKARTIMLHAIGPGTGAILWTCDTRAMSVHSPPIFRGDDMIHLNPETHRIFIIDRKRGILRAEGSYGQLLTKQQRDRIQFMRPFKQYLLLVGTYGDIHTLAIREGR